MNDLKPPLDGNEHDAGWAPPAADDEKPEVECEDEDHEPEWLGYFRTEAPPLNLASLFICAAKRQVVQITRADFERRLAWCLEKHACKIEQEPHKKPRAKPYERPKKKVIFTLSEANMDQLFQWAVDDRQQMQAFSAFCAGLRSRRFQQVRSLIGRGLTNVKTITKLSSELPWSQAGYSAAEWETYWFGSLQEIAEGIAKQLRGEKRRLAEYTEYLRFGRTNLQSHLLRSRYADLKKLVVGTHFSRHLMLLLAAYAHASGLVSYQDSAEDSDFVDSIKMRVHRAKKSTKAIRTLLLSLLIIQGTAA